MGWLLALVGPVLSFLSSLFGGKSRDDEIALGRAQQQVEDRKADMAVVKAANRAAQSVSEKGVADDESNLDRGL